LKAANDKALVELQRINLEPPEKWPSDLRLDQMIQSMDVINVDGIGELYTYQTNDNLLSAVRIWIQGLVSAIVRVPVEVDERRYLALPPVPAWKSDHQDSMQFVVESSEMIDHGLRLGAKQEVVSRLRAWGDTVRFQFAWIVPRGHEGVCIWSLVYPGVHEWSLSVTGQKIPWHGLFLGPPPNGVTPATLSK
jgi:hypothetical protein